MRVKHQSTSTCLVVMCIAILVAFAAGSTYAFTGSGSQVDPYRISTAGELVSIGGNPSLLDKHYILVNTIDLEGYEFTKAVIAPDLDNSLRYFQGTRFTGSFDGNGFSIINLTIDNVSDGDASNDTNCYLGLFGEVDGEILNLGVENVYIAAPVTTQCIGGLCGSLWRNGSITNCYSTGRIEGYRRLGGLCGWNRSGWIVNSGSSCDISGVDFCTGLGGLCGDSYMGFIWDSYATGNVTGGMNSGPMGGLCGLSDSGGQIIRCFASGDVSGQGESHHTGGLCGVTGYSTRISDSYARGSVSGGYGYRIGGLCGYNYFGDITNCYSTGEIIAEGFGGLCGDGPIERVVDCYWDTQTSGVTTSRGGTGKTTAEMKDRATFERWDFSNIWGISPWKNDGYPHLLNVGPVLNVGPLADAGDDDSILTIEQDGTTIIGIAEDPDSDPLEYRWSEGSTVLLDWTPVLSDKSTPLDLSLFETFTTGPHTLTLEVRESATVDRLAASDDMVLTVQNTPPSADAGDNVLMLSSEQGDTILCGTASDFDGNPLEYRWAQGDVGLLDWTPLLPDGQACLHLSPLPYFPIGDTTLTLSVREQGTSNAPVSDDLILTVNNSPPQAQPAPTEQTVEIGVNPIVVVADASDFDGDPLDYEWMKGTEVLASGTVSTIVGGDNVQIPDLVIPAGDPRFLLGTHTVELKVNDAVNDPVSRTVAVTVQDTQAPTLTPIPSVTMLWPPNHDLHDVVIAANASDNSSAPVALAVTVHSSEPPDTDGDGHTIPDCYIDFIDEQTGLIQLRLRAERAGKGDGRTYTITITVTDTETNSSSAVVTILAPHDKRKAK